MAKKIIILNGSPRKNGNTSALTAEFKRGAEELGHEVKEFHVAKMKINGCIGCWHANNKSNIPCTQKDDMMQIYPFYKEADVLVLASPLYYWFITGFLKNAFDRLFAVAECEENYRNPKKDTILLLTAASSDNEIFKECEFWYDRIVEHLKWNSLGKVFCGDVLNIGDIENKKELQDAYNLGKSI